MTTEIEAKFLDVNHDAVRARLKAAGATLVTPMRMLKRVILDYPDHRLQKDHDGYVRVRDEGDKITLTYKQFNELSVDGARELELHIDSFDTAVQMFEAIGLKIKSSQESKRETWQLNGVEIVLDEWPWLEPYIEIEAATETEVKQAAEILEFEWSRAVFGGVNIAYDAQYPGHTKEEILDAFSFAQFGDALPELFNAQQ
jgi:adenylate cyclase class 2